MSTLMERGLAMATRGGSRAAGGSILYERGDNRLTIDEAVFGQTAFQVEDAGGIRVEHSDRDFIFPAIAMIFAGSLATPQRGDRVTIIGHDEVYEVLAPGGAQVYRDTGMPGAMMRRVHTKKLP
jgi:hypothetical protein